ncbi:MAG: hypothetical protein HQ591_05320 [candidate division Zixibacteria bacterium]|nr:hypothetical protein [Candidatus Tariuqbacter arcticus]
MDKSCYIEVEKINIPFWYKEEVEATKSCVGFLRWKKKYRECKKVYSKQKDLLENLNVAKLFLDVDLKVELEPEIRKKGRNPDLRIYKNDSTLFCVEVTRFRINEIDEIHNKIKNNIVEKVKEIESNLCFDLCFKRRLRDTDKIDKISSVIKNIMNLNIGQKEKANIEKRYLIYENFKFTEVSNWDNERNDIIFGIVVSYSDYCNKTTYLGMGDDFNIYTENEVKKFACRLFCGKKAKYEQLPEDYPGIITVKDDSLHHDFRHLKDALYRVIQFWEYDQPSVIVLLSEWEDKNGNMLNELLLNPSASNKLSNEEMDIIKDALKISH